MVQEKSKTQMLSALAALLSQVENMADETAAIYADDDWQARRLTNIADQIGFVAIEEVAKMLGYEVLENIKHEAH